MSAAPLSVVAPRPRGSALVVTAAVAGILSPVIRATATVLEGAAFNGYSHVANAISELGAIGAPTADWHHATTVVVGLLQVGFAGALWHRGARATAVAAALAGAGLVGGAVFSPHLGMPLPGGDGFSATDALHGAFGILSGIGFAAQPLLGWRQLDLGRSHRRFSAVFALLTLVTAVVALVGVGDAVKGLVQRVFVITASVWQVGTAPALVDQSTRSATGIT